MEWEGSNLKNKSTPATNNRFSDNTEKFEVIKSIDVV